MIPYSRRGASHVADLLDHYDRRDRPEAMRNLLACVQAASDAIEANPAAGLPAPRTYPWLARAGQAWIKSGAYWIGYRRRPRLIIIAMFYDKSDIPGRI